MSEESAVLAESISAYARAETVAAAQRLAAIAELSALRLGSELAQLRQHMAVDGWDSCAAEVAAELRIPHRRASGMMHQGLDLRDRIPLMGALFQRGDITLKVATTASWRTKLILDDELLARVDADLAEVASQFTGYSDDRLNDAIDATVGKYDPDAVRRFKTLERTLNVQYGKPDDETGTVSVYGRVKLTDAVLSERRVERLANSVCPNDPRTHGVRRAEAWGVIHAGGDHLPCLCGRADCPAPTGEDARGKYFDILVLTNDPDAGSGDAPDGTEPDGGPRDDDEPTDDDPSGESPEHSAAEPDSPTVNDAGPRPCNYTSLIAGGGVVPAPLLAELRRIGAAVRTVAHPEDLTAEPHYRPSVALQRFVRARDMTCRFPGCDHPAEYADLDHTVPYDTSRLTHPGNMKSLCRKHHLLKTFWVGRGGWTDEQLPDGTIVWTTPTGRRKSVPPGSRILFSQWNTTTPAPPSPPATRTQGLDRTLRMPKRTRTRVQQQRAAVKAERERNRRERAEHVPSL
jgi:hypothetical protein